MAKKANSGLGSGIGTFTHTEIIPGYSRALSHASALVPRLKELDKKIRARGLEVAQAVRLQLQQQLFCPICGTQIPYQGETMQAWGKRRKCDACRQADIPRSDIVYCRRCGSSHKNDRINWSVCETCGDPSSRNKAIAQTQNQDEILIKLRQERVFICGHG